MTDSSRSNRRWQSSILNSALAMKFQGIDVVFLQTLPGSGGRRLFRVNDWTGWSPQFPHQPYCWDSAGNFRDTKAWILQCVPSIGQFFSFPLEHPGGAPSSVYWLVDRRSLHLRGDKQLALSLVKWATKTTALEQRADGYDRWKDTTSCLAAGQSCNLVSLGTVESHDMKLNI